MGGGVRCRFLRKASFTHKNQAVVVYSHYREKHEHAQNIVAICKTLPPKETIKKENPDALAGATGAALEASNFKTKDYPKTSATSNEKTAGSLAQFIAPQHKQISRMLGYCLTMGSSDGWQGFGLLAAMRLTTQERAFMAATLLATLHPSSIEGIAASVLRTAGAPLPPFLGGMEDARHWAGWASPAELKAYALACFEAMPPRDQAAFFAHIGTVEVAA